MRLVSGFGRLIFHGMVCVLVFMAGSASAQGHRGPHGRISDSVGEMRGERRFGPQQGDRAERRAERPDRNDQSAAGDRADAQRGANAQRGGEAQAAAGRMSPEERRQLRRDVRQAGRDLYSDRAPRRD